MKYYLYNISTNQVKTVVSDLATAELNLTEGFAIHKSEEDHVPSDIEILDGVIVIKSEAKATRIRQQRNEILTTIVDPIASNALRWADLTEQEQSAWAQYRRDLLNITDQAGFPNEVTWPSPPGGV